MPIVNQIVKKNGKIIKSKVEIPAPVYNVRIKQEVYERLVVLAAENGRSITGEINYRLEQSLKKQYYSWAIVVICSRCYRAL